MPPSIYVPPLPVGVNPPTDNSRTNPVPVLFNGDEINLRFLVKAPNGDRATPENCRLRFVLCNQRFSQVPTWSGLWRAGIELVPNSDLVEVRIPDAISARLRRGSFDYSMTMTDTVGDHIQTVACGSFLVEYAPTSPSHDIPYSQ